MANGMQAAEYPRELDIEMLLSEIGSFDSDAFAELLMEPDEVREDRRKLLNWVFDNKTDLFSTLSNLESAWALLVEHYHFQRNCLMQHYQQKKLYEERLAPVEEVKENMAEEVQAPESPMKRPRREENPPLLWVQEERKKRFFSRKEPWVCAEVDKLWKKHGKQAPEELRDGNTWKTYYHCASMWDAETLAELLEEEGHVTVQCRIRRLGADFESIRWKVVSSEDFVVEEKKAPN